MEGIHQTEPETEKQARLTIMELANMISVPMSLNAVIELNIPDIIWQGGTNQPLSPSQIAAQIPTHNPQTLQPDPSNLQRILRMLTSYNVFTEHSVTDSNQKKYSLTQVGKILVTDRDGLSFGAYVLQHHQEALVRSWPLVHQAVLDPSREPFAIANGISAYSYYGKNPEANDLMQRAMSGVSVPFMRVLLDCYDGFEGLKRLVDVGGSSGACLNMILQRYPRIEGVNFDLPEVVEKATVYPGVIHVGGDMFESIPSGDAIFMKWILTTWTDEECKAILRNCHKALPAGGKVIACEPVLPENTDGSQRTRALLEGDVFVMTIYRAKGKERSEREFRQLGASVGFPKFRAIDVDHFYTLLEFQK